MKMLSIVAVGAIFILAMFACGDGSEDRVLHLEGFDITEVAYQSAMRSGLKGEPGILYCTMIQDLTPQELMEDGAELPPGATPIPNQIANPDDSLKAGTIIKEICASISP